MRPGESKTVADPQDFKAYPFADGSYPDTWIACDIPGCEYGCGECGPCGYILGAAVAFGLMGMAEAIRRRCTCAKRGSAEDDWADLCEVCKGYP